MPLSARNRLITDNLPLVGHLANTIDRGTLVSREELASAGALALVMAADAFNADLGVPFGAYARQRILGAFIDEMRSRDWASRGIRKRVKETSAVRETLTTSLGRPPTINEMATTMGVDAESVSESLADARRIVTSFDEDVLVQTRRSDGPLPDEVAETTEREELLASAVEALPEKMRFIIRAVYFDDRSVKSIAEELGVTHSAVSQQRSQAVRLLREALANRFEPEEQTSPMPPATMSASAKNAYFDRLAAKSRRFAKTFVPLPVAV